MFKRNLAFLVAAVFLATVFVGNYGVDYRAFASSFRNGFSLVSNSNDTTGVTPDSTFTLESEELHDIDSIKKSFSIDGELEPKIEKLADTKFTITPSKKLFENRIYIFRLKMEGKEDTTWAFQTQATFKILGTLPQNQSTNVPINSGIEIYFTHNNVNDIKEHFQITPSTDGRFEFHDKTIVFVPKELKKETVYTVTLKKGIKIKDTDRLTLEDYAFSFETSGTNESDAPLVNGNINFSNRIFDVTNSMEAYLPLDYWINESKYSSETFTVKANIYSYNNFEQFTEAYLKKDEVPDWAYLSYSKAKATPNGLDKIIEFEQKFKVRPNYQNPIERMLKLPEVLPIGHYLVECSFEDIHFQTFLQVTNTGIYITKSNTKTLIWLNDMITKEPISGAGIWFKDNEEVRVSNKDGVVYTDSLKIANNETGYNNQYLKVQTGKGEYSILNCSEYYYDHTSNNKYWNFMQTDRNLYQPDDTVKVWGFLKNRVQDEEIKDITITLSGGTYSRFYSYSRYYIAEEPVLKNTVDTENNFFETEFKLPNLEQGGYTVSVRKGDTIISSTYITVEKYTKPTYKIEIEKDKEAVFPNSIVGLKIKTSFFEGTPVANLNTDILLNDSSIAGQNKKYTGKTDVNGIMPLDYVPVVDESFQGEHSVNVTARATLPENGEISQSSDIRVFVNNIDVNFEGRISGGKAKISANIHEITLDRLNNNTAKDRYDYLGNPVANKKITGEIIKHTWNKIKDGETYDFINKISVPNYRYEKVETKVNTIDFISGFDGKGEAEINLPEEEDSYYTAEMKCIDNSGKKMKFSLYLWKEYPGMTYYNKEVPTVDESIHLEGNKEKYKISEDVSLTFKKGLEVLPSGRYLYILSQDGIFDYYVSDKPYFSHKFTEKDMPNVHINGVYFDNSSVYNTASYQATFDFEEKKITIKASLDKESYRPGEEATIKINATDINNNPVKAVVNASIVDEALLKLSENNINILESLYSTVSSGIYYTQTSHSNSGNTILYAGGGMKNEKLMFSERNSMDQAAPTASKESSQEVIIRKDFKDTALFKSIETDENGNGTLTFKLPDNVTSWRISLQGISNKLHAGSDKVNMNVTLPFFLNYSLNTTYLMNDKPVIGVNAYGNELNENDLVRFEISSVQNPSNKVSAVGKAFERVNIPLWTLVEGREDITIKAFTNSGLSDGMKHSIDVLKSYYQIKKHNILDLKPSMELKGGQDGNTRLVFIDKGRGQFLSTLFSNTYVYGNRIDKKVAKNVSIDLVEKYFKDLMYLPTKDDTDFKEYQKSDGGIALLPYSGSELDLSARLSAYLKEEVDINMLKGYFHKVFNEKVSANTVPALLGLATLKEPVLFELDEYSGIENLSIRDNMYLSLAYYELGETSKAKMIYDEKIKPELKKDSPYVYVSQQETKDSIVELTSICSLLASKLNTEEKEGLYEYIINNDTTDIYMGFAKLAYVESEIENYPDQALSFKYDYNGEEKVVTLDKGGMHSLNIPSTLLSKFKVIKVDGLGSLVTIYQEGVESISGVDSNLKVTRTYYHLNGEPLKNNTLKQGDMIKVLLTCSIDPKSLDGSYELTDYLPSGLKPVTNDYNMGYYYRNIDGQKVKFSLYSWKGYNEQREFEYLARVVSPGTYTAQGPILQSEKAPSIINTGKNDVITIDSNGEVIVTPLNPNAIKVKINDRDLVYDVEPFIENGRTLVSMRSIFEVLGADVTWDEKNKTITCTKDDKKIVFTIGSNTVLLNDKVKTLDVPAKIFNSRTFIPARFVSESLGAKVGWDENSKTVLIAN